MDGAASNSSASVYLLSPPVLITIFYTARFASWAAFAFHSDTYGSSAAMMMVRTNEPMVYNESGSHLLSLSHLPFSGSLRSPDDWIWKGRGRRRGHAPAHGQKAAAGLQAPLPLPGRGAATHPCASDQISEARR